MMPNFNLFVVSSNLPVNVQGIERVTELFSFTNFVFHFSNANEVEWNGFMAYDACRNFLLFVCIVFSLSVE